MAILTIDPGFRNLSWCLVNENGFIEDHRLVCLYTQPMKKNKTINWKNIHKQLTEWKPMFENWKNVEHVFIERQIQCKQRMLAAHLYTFFYYLFPSAQVDYMDSSKKLSLWNLPPQTYTQRKKESIHQALQLLKDYKLQYVFNFIGQRLNDTQVKKKDDLADSLLMAWYHLQKLSLKKSKNTIDKCFTTQIHILSPPK